MIIKRVIGGGSVDMSLEVDAKLTGMAIGSVTLSSGDFNKLMHISPTELHLWASNLGRRFVIHRHVFDHFCTDGCVLIGGIAGRPSLYRRKDNSFFISYGDNKQDCDRVSVWSFLERHGTAWQRLKFHFWNMVH